MTNLTNDTTAAAAASDATLDLSETAVIGIFQRPSGASALIRMADGEIRSVSVGDSIDGAEVTVIGENGLYLARAGQQTALVMPAG